ncbi:MAG: phosphatase PAP2 family protein [Pseudomonadota bacterium]
MSSTTNSFSFRLAGPLRFDQTPLVAIGVLVALAALATVWAGQIGLGFGPLGPLLAGSAALLVIGLCYDTTRRSRALADGAYYFALWVNLMLIACILSYLAAWHGGALYDQQFERIDALFGFAWEPWNAFVRSNHALYWVLLAAYASGGPQILAAVVYFACTGQSRCNQELWWISLLAMLLTVAVAALFPALGAFYHFQQNLDEAVHLPHLLALRDHSAGYFSSLEGIVTLPSYHTAQALLFIYAFRAQRRLFPWMLALNVLVLVSTPSMGGHYLADMLAGAAVAALAVLLVRWTLPSAGAGTDAGAGQQHRLP